MKINHEILQKFFQESSPVDWLNGEGLLLSLQLARFCRLLDFLLCSYAQHLALRIDLQMTHTHMHYIQHYINYCTYIALHCIALRYIAFRLVTGCCEVCAAWRQVTIRALSMGEQLWQLVKALRWKAHSSA